MPKRKVDHTLQKPSTNQDTGQIPSTMLLAGHVHPRFHPPLSASQLADCQAGTCPYCQWIADIKFKHELIFGPPNPALALSDAEESTDGDEPTIREDNIAFEKICELEAENARLRDEVQKLRKNGKRKMISELMEEDDHAGDARVDVDDSAIELNRALKMGKHAEGERQFDVGLYGIGAAFEQEPTTSMRKNTSKTAKASTRAIHNPLPTHIFVVELEQYSLEGGVWRTIDGVFSNLKKANTCAKTVFHDACDRRVSLWKGTRRKDSFEDGRVWYRYDEGDTVGAISAEVRECPVG